LLLLLPRLLLLLLLLLALHAELEPGYPAECSEVAVVGISNWALDAAKLSRAVLLSR
jgi:hypothetical protein